jgi:HSP20 family protein
MSHETSKEKRGKAEREIDLEDVPFFGGILKGVEKLVDLAERLEEAGGEIKKSGRIKGLRGQEGVRGVYGFSIRTGIDDVPRVQTFGNIRPVSNTAKNKKVKVSETREPLVDVFDEIDHIRIVAELPGIDEKSIRAELKKDRLILEASSPRSSMAGGKERMYATEILLPCKVAPASQKMNFKNGVLEITFQKP